MEAFLSLTASFSLRTIFRTKSSFLNKQVFIPTRGLLSNAVRGVTVWKTQQEKQENSIDLSAHTQLLISNLQQCRYAKASSLIKIFDNVHTNEDLEIAENALLEFRKGYNLPRSSLPLIVVRACVRVDKPQKALHIISRKVQYGVFPTVRVYNVLMDSFLSQRNGKGIVKTFQQLLMDELEPNGLSYVLAVFGHLLQGMTEEAQVLCDKCLALSYKEGVRAYHGFVKYCLEKEDLERAKDVLSHLNKTTPINKKFDLNCRIRGLISVGDHESALSLLESLKDEGSSLRVSTGVIDLLETTLTGNHKEAEIKILRDTLQRLGKITL